METLHKYVVLFSKLFPILDRGPNRAHVGKDHCYLIVLYVGPYCCFWKYVGEHFENPLGS